MKRQEQREWLVRLTYAEELNGDSSHTAEGLLEAQGLPTQNTYLAESLRSLLAHPKELDALILPYLRHWKTDRLRAIDRAILRVAVNEMVYTKFAPAPVTINESVELAKKYSDESAYRFINGVLSTLVKKMEEEKNEDAKREALSEESVSDTAQ